MKLIRQMFDQMLLICFGLLVWAGIYGVLHRSEEAAALHWNFPLTFLLAGVLGALLQLIFLSRRELSPQQWKLRTGIHFLALLGLISATGWIFKWFTSFGEYMISMLVFTLVYALSWVWSYFSMKRDEKRINKSLEKLKDME